MTVYEITDLEVSKAEKIRLLEQKCKCPDDSGSCLACLQIDLENSGGCQ